MKERSGSDQAPNSPVEPARNVPKLVQILLFTRAGGRCQFDGCNEYLLQHPVTLTEANFAEMAHIVAFREGGPRGKEGDRPDDINGLENLMLLCPSCHKEIDTRAAEFPRAVLEQYKEAHEDRILHVTGLGPDLKTAVVQVKAFIGDQAVAIPLGDVTKAVAPRYPMDRRGTVIDLTPIDVDGPAFIDAATAKVRRDVARLYEDGMEPGRRWRASPA